ncbi:MAG TPA: hypothetical protein VGM56_10880 [Byssovorax sp.]|jgi:hypothetical protein
MNVQDFISEFLNSEHGQSAASALADKGVSDDVAQQALSEAAAAGHAHTEEQGGGLLGNNAGKSFLGALAAGLVKGDGLWGSIGDGLEGVLVGRITEAIAARVGVDPGTAATIAATVTPYVASFIKSKLAG